MARPGRRRGFWPSVVEWGEGGRHNSILTIRNQQGELLHAQNRTPGRRLACLLALAAVTAFGGAALAAPSKAKSPSEAMADAARNGAGGGGLEVVADGLDNPRGIGFGPDGALYVAESGSGGPVAPGNCITAPRAAGRAASAAPAP